MANTSVRRAETDPNNGSNTTATFSVWIKRSLLGAYQTIYNHRYTNSYEFKFMMYNDDRLYVICTRSSTVMEFLTTRRFRDTNAWYHIVIALDSTQATNTNRVKIYVNGEQETAFDTATYPAQDAVLNLDGGNGYYNNVGSRGDGSSEYWDGSMAYLAKVDGTQESPSIFGQTDATTGEWSIKATITPSSGWGNKPFFILKDGNSLTDQSGSSKDFTSHSGTLTPTEDCPSNVFATLNPIDKGKTGTMNFANGNTTTMNTSGFGDYGARSTLGVDSGKFYWEVKIGSNTSQNAFGILPSDVELIFDMFGSTPEANLYGTQRSSSSVTNFFNNTTFISGNSDWGGAITSSDVVGFALDMDNGKLYLSKNGAFKDLSGNTSNLSSGTYPTFTIADTSKTYSFYVEMRTNDDNGLYVNFGNGYFGTTAISSEGTNASGVGKFEYDVPTGFTALSTKGLNL